MDKKYIIMNHFTLYIFFFTDNFLIFTLENRENFGNLVSYSW